MKSFILAAAGIALLTAGIVRVELAAQPQRAPARNTKLAAKQHAMIEAAQKAYEAVSQNHMLGTGSHDDVYVWSSHMQSSQVGAAESKQQATKACAEHLDRMQRLHARVSALHQQGAKGGEADKFHATQFYLAQAEVILMEAKGNEDEG